MMKNTRLLTIFLIVFVDLLGFGLILPLLPYYAESSWRHPGDCWAAGRFLRSGTARGRAAARAACRIVWAAVRCCCCR